MSRHVKQEKDIDIAYGHDHATGYFFQVFGPDIDGEENLLVDECSMFSHMSNARMVELMKQYKVNEDHINMVLMDLTF